ncbi:phosphate ABC transporter substrate-binding protein PstS [Porphyromonas pogonae]|uniref:phosphate ABC transporter substrate-binding protein PstS n=1 Tax=Porphyromonas pogonae TaxID=867595 RepID=UPI002E784F2E|nr:phosphate ABC transporter substrate-binding protein PstS [Porphyromonas pogonae]
MKKVISIITVALLLMGCAGGKKENKGTSQLDGAGATFPLPFYTLAFKTYQEQGGPTVNYGAIGSGGGIRSLKDEIVDFAASDAFLKDDEATAMKPVIHIPTCMGAVVLAYNLDGVQDLKLTAEVISKIYLGEIKKWNDSAIKSINPGVNLPDKAITPVYRSDGSGTTYIFSDYLSKAYAPWKDKMGAAKSLKWSVGIAGKGNPGVAGVIAQTPGAIGYVGSEYSFSLNIPSAKVMNKAGNFISPSIESISASATGNIPEDTRTMITDADGAEAYPISCLTWILIYKDQNYKNRSIDKAHATVDMLKWILGSKAQELTPKVHYAPLPQNIIELALRQLNTVTYNGKALGDVAENKDKK